MDFGCNYFTDYIDFYNKVITLKDNKSFTLLNFQIYDKSIYKTCVKEYREYLLSNHIVKEEYLNDVNIYFSSHNLTSYLQNILLDMIVNNIESELANSFDIIYDILKLKKQVIAIPVFTSATSKYICVCNFNSFLSKCIQKANPSSKRLTQLVSLTTGVSKMDKITKLSGFKFNLMKTLWDRINTNQHLMLYSYKIENLTFNLGNLLYSLINKFPEFYIIFKTTSARFQKCNRKFMISFKNCKDKKQRAKELNKKQNMKNILLKDVLNETEVDIVNILDSIDKLSLLDNKMKKTQKKCIKTEYNTINSMNTDELESNRKEIHSICKNKTGSKHCYYQGFKSMIKDFDNFLITQNSKMKKLNLGNESKEDFIDKME